MPPASPIFQTAKSLVDFESVRAQKLPLLREAARNFLQGAEPVGARALQRILRRE